MNVGDFLERWGKTLFETPLGVGSKTDEPPELAEIRLAVLDRIREKSYRSGGKKVFPYRPAARAKCAGWKRPARRFRGTIFPQLYRAGSAQCAARRRLPLPGQSARGCGTGARHPQAGRGLALGRGPSQERSDAGGRTVGKLVVRAGDANITEFRLDKVRTNIGRVVDVYRAEGLFRRNDLAFEAETEINRSVSREHAHIQYDRAADEYRLFNDRWYAARSARRVRDVDCARWNEPGSPSHLARDEAGSRR